MLKRRKALSSPKKIFFENLSSPQTSSLKPQSKLKISKKIIAPKEVEPDDGRFFSKRKNAHFKPSLL